MEIIENINNTFQSSSNETPSSPFVSSKIDFIPPYLKVIGQILTSLNDAKNKFLSNQESELSKKLSELIQNYTELFK
jgi:hypothetical protein